MEGSSSSQQVPSAGAETGAGAAPVPAEWRSADGSVVVSSADVSTTSAVLQALVDHDELWKSKLARPVRKSLAVLSERMEAEKARNLEAAEQAKRERRAKAEANARKLMDKQFIEKSKLRAGRLLRLKELGTQGDGSAEGLLIPDGAAETDSQGVLAGPQRLLTDGSEKVEAASAATAPDTSSPAPAADGGAGEEEEGPRKLHGFRSCYVCKARFQELHHYYDQLCPVCAPFNFQKRYQTVDLSGRIALVTGARIKIGFYVALKLLRAGARVIATSRFPHDTAGRFAAQPDYATWKDRLDIYGLDFRDLRGLESFCAHLYASYTHLDIIINNACQTVRRPAAFYSHLMETEMKALADLPPEVAAPLEKEHAYRAAVAAAAAPGTLVADAPAEANPAPAAGGAGGAATAAGADSTTTLASVASAPAAAALPTSAAMSQLPMAPEDTLAPTSTEGSSFEGKALFPTGLVDTNGQQIDLRRTNSWVLRMHEVSTPELLEVFAINAMAPFIINARLRALMTSGRPPLPAGLPRITRASTGAVPRGFADQAQAEAASSSSAAAAQGEGEDEAGCTEPAAKRARRAQYAAATPRVPGSMKLLGEVAPAVPAALCRFIVNVSAMEGKFSRAKIGGYHPHTNAAKASLNMMTRTSAGEFADELLFMNASDTGWINDENPVAAAARTAVHNAFQTPIDEVDAAARILDPIFAPLLEAQNGDGTCRPVFGAFFKDYYPSEW